MPEPMEILSGVTRAQFAFMRAGLADGLALEDLLAYHELDGPTWETAEAGWNERMLDAIEQEDASFLHAFDEEMAEARAHWERLIPPLDEDLQAWLDFLRAWTDGPEPVELLARAELKASDLVRLHQHWSRRLDREPSLAVEALAILGRDPGEPCIPRPERARLRRQRVEADHLSTTGEVRIAKLTTLPFVERDPSPPLPRLATPLPRRPRAPAARGLGDTDLLRAVPAVAPLPFTPPLTDVKTKSAEEPPSPPENIAPAPLTPLPKAPPASAVVAAVSPTAPAPSAPISAPAAPLETTLPPFSRSPGSELPFTPSGFGQRRIGAPLMLLGPPAPAPSIDPTEQSPFDEDAAPASKEAPPHAPVGGDTAPVAPGNPRPALPFTRPVRTAVGFGGGGDETVAIKLSTGSIHPFFSAFAPGSLLSLEQHARLCAELKAAPERSAEILERHGLTPETKKTQDDYWNAELARDPSKLGTWTRVYAEAHAALSSAGETK